MIEINLLPDEYRPGEGMPMPRLLTILVGLLLLIVGGTWCVNLYFETVRQDKEIAQKTQKETQLKQEKVAVEELNKQLEDMKKKLAGLKNLQNSRVLWSRLLHRLRKCFLEDSNGGKMPGCVITSFALNRASGNKNNQTAFAIKLRGLTSGKSDKECSDKLTEIQRSIKKRFDYKNPDDSERPDQIQDAQGHANWGYSDWLNLKLDGLKLGRVSYDDSGRQTLKVDTEDEEFEEEVEAAPLPRIFLTFELELVMNLRPTEQ